MRKFKQEDRAYLDRLAEVQRQRMIKALKADQRQAELFSTKVLALFIACIVAFILMVVIYGEPVNTTPSTTGAKHPQEQASEADESYEPTIVPSRLFPGSIPLGGGMGLM